MNKPWIYALIGVLFLLSFVLNFIASFIHQNWEQGFSAVCFLIGGCCYMGAAIKLKQKEK